VELPSGESQCARALLESAGGRSKTIEIVVNFEFFTAVTMKNAVFWDVALQPPTLTGSSLAAFSTLKMETIHSSETPGHTRSTWRRIPEDGIHQNSSSPEPDERIT
jgi:hypothetical protein